LVRHSFSTPIKESKQNMGHPLDDVCQEVKKPSAEEQHFD
jgi:hypothetical protein